MKKSKTTSKSSVKTTRSAVKKTTAPSQKAGQKTAKTASSSIKKKEVKEKAPVPRQKAPDKRQMTSVSSAKTSLKKTVAGKETKTVKKSETKKPLEKLKGIRTKPSKPKTVVKPIAVKSAIKKEKLPQKTEAKKIAKAIVSSLKPEKTSLTPIKGKKTAGKETVTTAGSRKAATPGKKPAKKSATEKIVQKPKIAQKKTAKPAATKVTSVKKRAGAVAEKTGAKTAKEIKVAVVAEDRAKEKKSPASSLKTTDKKKPSPGKPLPIARETAKQETALKSKPKTEAPPSASRKSIMKKETSASLITGGAVNSMREKPADTLIVHPQADTKLKTSPKLKIFLPDEELPPEECQAAPSPALSEEYGENELLLMEVDPSIVFVSWEIKPDDIAHETGKLTLRVYDVTGIDFDCSPANRFFDISLKNRVDSKFIDIKMPGRDVIMEVGVLHPEGTYKPIKRSNRVSMPELQTFDELGITGAFSDTDTSIGY